jgi:hypothetical protein
MVASMPLLSKCQAKMKASFLSFYNHPTKLQSSFSLLTTAPWQGVRPTGQKPGKDVYKLYCIYGRSVVYLTAVGDTARDQSGHVTAARPQLASTAPWQGVRPTGQKPGKDAIESASPADLAYDLAEINLAM